MKRKGATVFDRLCHALFEKRGNGKDYLGRVCGVDCGRCGHDLLTYYCEEGLFLVECDVCKTKALVKAQSPSEAAYRTFGHAVYPVEEMGEECAVFFAHVPIDEPPYYVGSTSQ